MGGASSTISVLVMCGSSPLAFHTQSKHSAKVASSSSSSMMAAFQKTPPSWLPSSLCVTQKRCCLKTSRLQSQHSTIFQPSNFTSSTASLCLRIPQSKISLDQPENCHYRLIRLPLLTTRAIVPGGSVKIIDTTTFPISKSISAALVVIELGAMRELYWHLTSDEWNYFLQGSARITVYMAPASSRTFDYTAGDVGYVPAVPTSNSHYIENTGTEYVIFLEVLKQPIFTDISVAQWLTLTPKQVVQDTLHLPDETLDNLPKHKTYLKPGNRNLTVLAANPNGTAAYEPSG
jgi:oxalate decarboxylase family bicupin protein